jgi:DASH complex subunit ASK1
MVSSPGHYTAGERTGDDDFTRDQETRHIHGLGSDDDDDGLLEDSLLESLNLTTGGAMQSTPKPVPTRSRAGQATEWADMESPYEVLAKELTMKYQSPELPQQQQRQRYGASASSADSSMLPPPTTPRTNRNATAETPESSPFHAPPVARTPGIGNDRVMHRVLDKNWRIQATPLRSAVQSRYRTATTPKQPPLFVRNSNDSSPISSPPEPQLQTQIFTPGVLRTPGAKRFEAATTARGDVTMANAASKYMYDDDSDDDLLLPPGFSPPKTMQFSLPPSKLMATPAREASKRIVRDILQTAGASVDGTMTTDASSPMRGGMNDDDDDPF